MSENPLVDYLHSSFLSPLLDSPSISDICYNGASIFYEDNLLGRKKSAIEVSKEEVGCFLRQIANLSEKQFSYQTPIMDVSFSRYRLNACFLNLVRVQDEKSYSFSLRLTSKGSKVSDSKTFLIEEQRKILSEAIRNKRSIIIAGGTGSGKTELQKYLLLAMKDNSRVIVIDNVEELENARNDNGIDLTSWLVDERFPASSFPSLIKNALRSDPDYILVAEARGSEMLSLLNAAMSGHPVISTLHSNDLSSIPHRMARMAMMGVERLLYQEVLDDIYRNFPLFCLCKKEEKEDGSLIRYLSAIGESVNGEIKTIQSRERPI